MEAEMRALPKAELHCHIDGILDPAMVDELARAGEVLPLDVDRLRSLYPVDSVPRWLDGYVAHVDPGIEPRDHWLPRILELHLGRLRAQRVVYTEILVSRLLFVRDDVQELVEYFTELRRRAIAAAGPDLTVELLICIGRGPSEKVAPQIPRIAALRRAGLIRGIALAGLERFPVRPLRPFLDELRDLGLGIEIHAGEFAGPESVRDALEHGSPDRLGHGLAAFGDEALLSEIGERGIHLEFCPTSNLRLGRIARVEDHPIGRARDLGLSFSINTDDPGPFECSVTSEYALVAETFGFTADDLRRVVAQTPQASFARR